MSEHSAAATPELETGWWVLLRFGVIHLQADGKNGVCVRVCACAYLCVCVRARMRACACVHVCVLRPTLASLCPSSVRPREGGVRQLTDALGKNH